MPTYTFTSPDGKTYDVNGPDGSTSEQAFAQLQAHMATGAPAPKDVQAPTSDEPPGLIRQYLSDVGDVYKRAGKSIEIGSTAMVGGILSPFNSPEYNSAVADTVQSQAHDLQKQEEAAGSINGMASKLMGYSNPITGIATGVGDATSKAVTMQDMGQDPSTLANRINLGGTTAINSALSVLPGAATAKIPAYAIANPLLRGTATAGLIGASGAAIGYGTVDAQRLLDNKTGNAALAPTEDDALTNTAIGAVLPMAMHAGGGINSAIKNRALRADTASHALDIDKLVASKGLSDAPITPEQLRGAEPVPSLVDNSVVSPAVAKEVVPPVDTLKQPTSDTATKADTEAIATEKPLTSVDAPTTAATELVPTEVARAPLSDKAQVYVDGLPADTQIALKESIDHLAQYPDPTGDKANLEMVVQGIDRKKAKLAAKTAADATPPVEPPVASEPAPTPPVRQFYKDDLGKLREVVDSTDPKHYAGKTLINESDLTPVQQKNLSKRKDSQLGRRGAAINPAEVIVAGARKVGHVVRTVGDILGNRDMGDFVRTSQHAGVNGHSDRITNAEFERVKSTQALSDVRNKALRDSAVVRPKDVAAIRKFSEPVIPNGNKVGNSAMYDALHGDTSKITTPLQKRIIDSMHSVHEPTAKALTDAGVTFAGKAFKSGVGLVRHFSDDARVAIDQQSAEFHHWTDAIANTNTFKDEKGVVRNYTPKEVRDYFVGDRSANDHGQSAHIQQAQLEMGRKFKTIPEYSTDAKGTPVKMLETDPHRYINATVDATARRVGFAKAFGADETASSVLNHPSLSDAPGKEIKKLSNWLRAYHNESSGSISMEYASTAKLFTAVRSAWGAAKLSLSALGNTSDALSMMAGHVPMGDAIHGLATFTSKRGVAESIGAERADTHNRLDLNSRSEQALGNARGAMSRATGVHASNRLVYKLAVHVGKAFAERVATGKITPSDTLYMNIHRIPESVQEKFRSGEATKADVNAMAESVARDVAGEHTSMAQKGILSQNRVTRLLAPLFRNFSENRVRQISRSFVEAARLYKNAATGGKNAALKAGAKAITARIFGVGASAALYGAVYTGLRYLKDGLEIDFSNPDTLLTWMSNLTSGGGMGTFQHMIENTQSNPAVDSAIGKGPSQLLAASSVVSNVGAIIQDQINVAVRTARAYEAKGLGAAVGKFAASQVPLLNLPARALTGEDTSRSLARQTYYQKYPPAAGSTGKPDANAAIKDALREAIVRGDRSQATLQAAKLYDKLDDPGKFKASLRGMILLGNLTSSDQETRERAIGSKAAAKIHEMDDLVRDVMAEND